MGPWLPVSRRFPRAARAGRRRVLGGAVLGLVPALVLGGCSGSAGPAPPAPEAVVTEVPPAQRTSLPPVRGRLLAGGQYDSRTLRGQVVVYNVWGSWCGPCRAEAPVLRRAAEASRSRGVRFIGLDTRDNDTEARAFERRYGIRYPSMVSTDTAQALLLFGPVLPLNAIPSTVVVDRNGRVAARVVGPVTAATLRGLIEDTLNRDRARKQGAV